MDCRAVLAIGLVACATASCESGPPWFVDEEPTWSGEIVDIVVDDGIRVCRGDLEALDSHARFVAHAIDTPLDTRVIYFWTDAQTVSELCWWGAGCALPEGGVGTSLWIGVHEIVHVLAADFGRSKSLWEEGLAAGFEPYPARKGEHHPAAMIDLGPERLSYMQAAHLFRWLWRDHASEMLDVYDATDSNDSHTQAAAAFEDAMGVPLEEMGDRYRDEAPELLFSLRNADAPPLPWRDGTWRYALQLDCEAEHTLSDPSGLKREVFVEIVEPGVYEFKVTTGTVGVETAYGADVWRLWKPDRSRWTLELDAGIYRVAVLVDGDGPFDVELSVRPSLLIQPTTPDGD